MFIVFIAQVSLFKGMNYIILLLTSGELQVVPWKFPFGFAYYPTHANQTQIWKCH